VILKHREIEIEESNPFINDALNRKESAETLTELIISTNDPLVICIDAPWGQGKTTFLRMWEQHLKNNNIPTIYFNAWENDFTDDALVSLIGEIGSAIDDISKNGDQSKAHEYLEKAKNIGVGLLKRSIPVAAKIATAGALDLDKITEQALASFAESIAKEQLEKYEKSKKALTTFRSALSDLAKSFSSDEERKPLVFIIDELDRCRPSFSIEVLEKAKHFFNVENIIFVLGADKEQLGHSIKAVYGNGLNVNGYLRRFIDLDYVLPSPDKGLFVKVLFQKLSFNEYFSSKIGDETRYEGRQALEMFTELFKLYNLTLREQEHCCSLLSLSIRTTPNNYQLYPLFLCFLIVLKINDPGTYKKFINEDLSPDQLLNYLSAQLGGRELLDTNYGMALEAYIISSKPFRGVNVDFSSKYKDVKNSNESTEQEKQRASNILKILNGLDWNGWDRLGYLINKIEISSRFSSS
jgi:hypothetical protein